MTSLFSDTQAQTVPQAPPPPPMMQAYGAEPAKSKPRPKPTGPNPSLMANAASTVLGSPMGLGLKTLIGT